MAERPFPRCAWLLVLALPALVAVSGCGPEVRPADGLAVTRLLAGSGDDAGYEKAVVPRAFVFPDDHGPHDGFRSEWWYLTAALRGEDGHAYGLQFTAFRQALRPPASAAQTAAGDWDAGQAYMAHLAVTSVADREHVSAQRFARGHPRLAGARPAPFAVWVDGWRLASSNGPDFSPLALRAMDPATGLGVDLRLTATREPLPQGDGGLSRKGPGEASYYYSIPRLSVSGRLEIDDRAVVVSGLAWFDREWSTSTLAAEHVGWDWFALMLDDGEDVMAFRLRRSSGERDPFDYARRRGAGADETLTSADFALTPTRWWRDPHGVRWPVGWRLEFADRTLLIDAALDDQRMDTAVVYWEGLVNVSDADGASAGVGYMELTGYQGAAP